VSGEVILTERQLQRLCAQWQKRLRVQDWDVRVRVKRRHQMELESKRAGCNYSLKLKEALIEIQSPLDYQPSVWPNDMEQSLVHELLHLHFALFSADDETPEGVAQEQAIDLIASALVSLARGEA
jgi:hypothetical protein